MRYRYVNGRRELAAANTGGMFMQPFTDDLGAFRMFGLEAGEYYVVARTRRDFGPASSAVPEGPAPTYYPGTLNVAEARRVTVRAGAETQNIVFQLALAKLARVSGRVISSFGSTERVTVQAMMREGGGMSSGSSATVKPDGMFEVRNLAPGSYELIARPMTMGPGGPGLNYDRERGRVILSLNGDDINDVTIAMVPGGVVRGRVVTDEGIELPGSRSKINVFLQCDRHGGHDVHELACSSARRRYV